MRPAKPASINWTPQARSTSTACRIVDVLVDIARQRGASPSQVAELASQQARSNTVILGAREEQLRDNLAAAQWTRRREMDRLDAVSACRPYPIGTSTIRRRAEPGAATD
jgi:aryl-alcohol dehydrogenase-like predicted oxidoreductase